MSTKVEIVCPPGVLDQSWEVTTTKNEYCCSVKICANFCLSHLPLVEVSYYPDVVDGEKVQSLVKIKWRKGACNTRAWRIPGDKPKSLGANHIAKYMIGAFQLAKKYAEKLEAEYCK